MDMRKLEFPDKNFDLIFCFNVLEHVKEDLKALLEIRRVLKPKGTILLTVPQDESLEKTIEYSEPDKRDSYHVRQYGADLTKRFKKAGLMAEEYRWENFFSQKEKEKYNLKAGKFFLLRRTII